MFQCAKQMQFLSAAVTGTATIKSGAHKLNLPGKAGAQKVGQNGVNPNAPVLTGD